VSTVTTDQIRDQFVLSLTLLPERQNCVSYVFGPEQCGPSTNQSWALSLLTLCRPLQRAVRRAAGVGPRARILIERGGSPPRMQIMPGDYCSDEHVVRVGADYVLSRDMLDLVRRRGRRRA